MTSSGHTALRDDFVAVCRDHGARLDGLERRLEDVSDKLGTLRQDVVDYHGSIMGHGILITERASGPEARGAGWTAAVA